MISIYDCLELTVARRGPARLSRPRIDGCSVPIPDPGTVRIQARDRSLFRLSEDLKAAARALVVDRRGQDASSPTMGTGCHGNP